MSTLKRQITPLGRIFVVLTKNYLSVFSAKLKDLPIDKYYYAFWVISENDGKITSKRLAEVLQTDKVLIVRTIKYLMDKKFIDREQHPNDKRSFLLHVTDYGKKYIPIIEQALVETDQLFLDALSKDSKELVLSEMTNLVNKVDPIEGDRIVLDYKRINK